MLHLSERSDNLYKSGGNLKVYASVPQRMSQSETDEIIECPECPKSAGRDPEKRFSAENRIARHMAQSTDHSATNYHEAVKTLNSGTNTTGEPGGGKDETPTQEGDGTETEVENPLLKSPVEVSEGDAIADGGTDECPECERELIETSEGFGFEGVTDNGEVVNGYTSDGNDLYCPDCDILIDEENTVVFG